MSKNISFSLLPILEPIKYNLTSFQRFLTTPLSKTLLMPSHPPPLLHTKKPMYLLLQPIKTTNTSREIYYMLKTLEHGERRKGVSKQGHPQPIKAH